MCLKIQKAYTTSQTDCIGKGRLEISERYLSIQPFIHPSRCSFICQSIDPLFVRLCIRGYFCFICFYVIIFHLFVCFYSFLFIPFIVFIFLLFSSLFLSSLLFPCLPFLFLSFLFPSSLFFSNLFFSFFGSSI